MTPKSYKMRNHCQVLVDLNKHVNKNMETKCCDEYQIYNENPADPASAPNSDLDLHKILKKDQNLLQAD